MTAQPSFGVPYGKEWSDEHGEPLDQPISALELADLAIANGHNDAALNDAYINAVLREGDPADPDLIRHGPTEHNLPHHFWDARPTLNHIRRAAHARTRSADVVLHAALTRIGAYAPHTLQIPAIVGNPAPLHTYTAAIGPSGTGKSSGCAVSGALITTPDGLDIANELPIGSGQGIAEAYMGAVTIAKPDGGTERTRGQVRHNALFVIDEGAALVALLEQRGSVLGETLRRGWTGSPLGQTNASEDRKRVIPAGQYTLGLFVGFQPTTIGPLLDDAHAGTPQRFGYASATDPTIPDTPPDWPGALHWQPPDTYQLAEYRDTSGPWVRHPLTVATPIATEVRAAELARARGQITPRPLDAHDNLWKLKTAALLALLDQRLEITTEDWQLAAEMRSVSSAVRDACITQRAAEEAEKTERKKAAHADMEAAGAAARMNVTDRTVRIARLLGRKVHEAGEDGLTAGGARHLLASRDRDQYETAVCHAAAQGWVIDTQAGLLPGEARPA